MSMLSSLLPLLLLLTSFTTPSSSSSTEAFVFSTCSQAKFTQGSTYEFGVNSLLTSIVNSAMFSSYNNLTAPASSSQDAPIYGLFQCRGDLAAPDCSRCVAHAVSQICTICPYSTGGALQLDGCFVKYDDSNFLGVEDMTLVIKKCDPSIGFTSDVLTQRDALLAHLETSDGMFKTFRTSTSGDLQLQGMAQCVGDLSVSLCQDCLSNAIGRLRVECGPATWGQIYLAKCYVRYSEDGDYLWDEDGDYSWDEDGDEHKSKNHRKLRKTKLWKRLALWQKLAITIGTPVTTVAGVTSVYYSFKIHAKLKSVKKHLENSKPASPTKSSKTASPTKNSKTASPDANFQHGVIICETRIVEESCACNSEPNSCTIQ